MDEEKGLMVGFGGMEVDGSLKIQSSGVTLILVDGWEDIIRFLLCVAILARRNLINLLLFLAFLAGLLCFAVILSSARQAED